jgi:hypothetical protein
MLHDFASNVQSRSSGSALWELNPFDSSRAAIQYDVANSLNASGRSDREGGGYHVASRSEEPVRVLLMWSPFVFGLAVPTLPVHRMDFGSRPSGALRFLSA